ncbi:MAG TPA: LacI family DNA-binding transcriptional regulator [Paenirhodobacter sp.]
MSQIPSKHMPKTMDDFAQACGVSRPTLSKYFENPDSVKATTRTRIELKLIETGYQPNLYARNLNRKRVRTVGIIVPSITDPFYAQLVTRVELILRNASYWPVTISAHGRRDLETEALRTLRSLKAGGALIAPLGYASDAEAFAQFTNEVPCIFLDNTITSGVPYVGNDNTQSVGVMMDYLCRSGHPPVYLDTPEVNPGSSERRNAYLTASAMHGVMPLVLPHDDPANEWDLERAGYERMVKLIRSGLPRPTVLCANDRLAIGALAAAFAAGLKVGHAPGCDLRIAGHDDHPLSRYSAPSLTTMAQDYEKMAQTACDLLLQVVEGRIAPADIRTTKLPGRLVMRSSA